MEEINHLTSQLFTIYVDDFLLRVTFPLAGLDKASHKHQIYTEMALYSAGSGAPHRNTFRGLLASARAEPSAGRRARAQLGSAETRDT
ncbi:hypothetical protein EYF80_011198 [Liparis tanakae]|uniref:Uncharacterized protein n=1 Tax=Liparis tanakae TaxID=230148 RepID=A0A4Z2IN67_9TELE|nr:hypothetical protein EYF80_011198 [Liparis tanakae]